MTARPYIVAVWHGEGGSMAYVKHVEFPDECFLYTSTIRDGADWLDKAQAECDRLNAAYAETSK